MRQPGQLQFVEFIKITTYIFVFPLWDCYAKARGKLGGLPAEAVASTGRTFMTVIEASLHCRISMYVLRGRAKHYGNLQLRLESW
jgi:hypothetical protein